MAVRRGEMQILMSFFETSFFRTRQSTPPDFLTKMSVSSRRKAQKGFYTGKRALVHINIFPEMTAVCGVAVPGPGPAEFQESREGPSANH